MTTLLTETPPSPIEIQGLDSPVVKLGLAIGLLTPQSGSPGTCELNASWFENPIANAGAALQNNGAEIAGLLADLLGSQGGKALGIPLKDPGTLGDWYPIQNPSTGAPTGLYLVAQTQNGATTFGLGTNYSWNPSGAIAIRVWGLAPLLTIGSGKVALAFGQENQPLTLGIEASSPEPLVDQYGFSLNGVRISGSLSFAPQPAAEISLVVLQLKLPTDAEASDRSLTDLEQVTGEQILTTVSALFTAAVAQALGQGNNAQVDFLLPLLGLSPQLPACFAAKFPGVSLPVLRWDQIAAGFEDGDPSRPFRDWFTALLSDSDTATAWLSCFQGIQGLTAPSVTGTGTRLDPYAIEILNTSAGTLAFTASTEVDSGGRRIFYPGARLASSKIALGSSPAAVRVAAELEFAQFYLSSGSAPSASFNIQFQAGIQLVGKGQTNGIDNPLFSGQIAGGTYTFGSLRAGLAVSNTAQNLQVIPAFELDNVVTPQGSYASLDLTQPGDVVQKAEQELVGLVSSALQQLFGITDGTKSPGYAVAALLGIVAPDTGDTSIPWPASLAPPLSSPSLITQALQNPLAALSSYYLSLLSTTNLVGGKVPIYYLVREAASLFSLATGISPMVTGSGSVQDPFQANIFSGSIGTANLQTCFEPVGSDGAQRIIFSLAFSAQFQPGLPVEINLLTDLLGLDVTPRENGTSVSAQIFPGIGIGLSLPQGITTPSIAGASIAVSATSLSVLWSPYSGWNWTMHVGQPSLQAGGKTYPVGQDMDYSDVASLEKLVTDSAQTFAGIFTGFTGIALLNTGTRSGLALTGILGLLPDLGSSMPEGIDWPADMPYLQLTNFNDPLGAIRAQVNGLLATPAHAKAALQLIGWAASTASAPPTISGSGSQGDPFLLPLGLSSGIGLAFWTGLEAGTAGFGITHGLAATLPGDIQAYTQLTLRLVEGSLTSGTLQSGNGVPGLSLSTTIQGSNGPLIAVQSGQLSLESLIVGLNAAISGSFAAPAITVTPLFVLTDLVLPGQAPIASVNVATAQGSTALLESLEQALNTALQAAIQKIAADTNFQAIYGLLATAGLAVPAGSDPSSYGINPAGWQALTADPLHFLSTALENLSVNPSTYQQLVKLLEQITGVTLPAMPPALLETLSALGLLSDEQHGYLPQPGAIVQLFSNPAAYLPAALDALLNYSDRLTQYLSALQQTSDIQSIGPISFQVTTGPVIELSLPPGKALIGGLLDFSGTAALVLGPKNRSFSLHARLLNPQAGIGISPSLDVDLTSSATTFQIAADWGDGSAPAPDPLIFYPFNETAFLQSLAKIAPAYALSTAVTQVIEPKLLQPYPLAQVLFNGLGLANKDTGGAWHMRPLLGLFEDPVGWFLSGSVLGQNGRLNISRLNTVLAQMPAVSLTAGLGTKSIANGFSVFGFPYNFGIDVTADADAGVFTVTPRLMQPLSIADGQATLSTAAFGVSLGADFQPAFSGSLQVAATVPGLSDPIAIATGYNGDFFLKVSEGTAGGATLQLVPFPGWQSLVTNAGQLAVQQLLPQLTSKLLDALSANGAQTFADALRKIASDLSMGSLVNALVSAAPDAAKLEAAALNWLTARLQTANAEGTASAVATLLGVVNITVTHANGLISYRPSDSLPVTLNLGVAQIGGVTQIGLWAALDLPQLAIVQASVQQTGIGMPFDAATGKLTSDKPSFNFGIALAVQVTGEDRAPTIDLAFDNASGEFKAGLDPLGKQNDPSSLYRELLPEFFGNPSNLGSAIGSWLLDVLKYAVPRYVSILLLNQKQVRAWLDGPLLGATPATALKAAQLILVENENYVLQSFDFLSKLDVRTFFAGLLKTLLSTQITVVQFGEGGKRGSIVLGPSSTGSGDYGIRVVARDLALPPAPNFVLQIGAQDSGWIASAGGTANLDPGLSVYVPINGTTPNFSELKLNLVNVGMDFNGKQQKPLIGFSRFSLGSVQPRALLTFDFATGFAPTNWGGQLTLDQIAISLAPNTLVTGANANPVAQNLLGSGSASNNGNKDLNNPPVNPAFSVSAAYVKGASAPYIRLFQDGKESQTQVWIPVQRSFGPLHVNMIGVEWVQQNTHAGVLFDGDVSLAGLAVSLQQLAVGFNVKNPTDYSQYTLDLAGLDISFAGGPAELSGGFYKQENPLRYDGAALLKVGSFGLDALGSYALIKDGNGTSAASVFVFVNINAPLGGPPAFFVTGLAAGFGFNRNILIPEPGDIGSFPFVAGAINANYFSKDSSGKADPGQALAKISTIVPPEIGQYWVAAGVKFTSFELLNTFALLFVKFGNDIEIDLVGVTSASLPPMSKQTIAYIELGIVISIRISEGYLSARAQLTPNSYLLAPECRLTGGFALVLGFSGPQAGNFVITLGGYHPAYKKPDFYPDVPRLGFQWPFNVSVGSLNINGGAYFALTPTAIMAGGYLRVAFEMGPIRAWLDAGADFLIQWKPFYYDIEIHVSVGVEFRTDIGGVSVTISASLGAGLNLWGPSTCGLAKVSWYVISFSIPIGDQSKSLATQPLGTWSDFESAFLPKPNSSESPVTSRARALRAAAPAPAQQQIVKATAPAGMLQENGVNGWLIRPSSWTLQVQSAIPATAVAVTGYSGQLPKGLPIGVRPMAQSSVSTGLTVTINGFNPTTKTWAAVQVSDRNLQVAAVLGSAPGALWSKDALNTQAPPSDPDEPPQTNVGLQITGADVTLNDPIGPIPIQQAFAFQKMLPLYYPKSPQWPASAALTQTNRYARLMQTIMDTTVATTRNAILQSLREHNVPALESAQLQVIAAHAPDLYQAAPTLAQLGSDLATQPVQMSLPASRAAAFTAAAPQISSGVRLLGAVRKYRTAPRRKPAMAGRAMRPLLLSLPKVTGKWIDHKTEAAPRSATGSFVTSAASAPARTATLRLFEGSAAVFELTRSPGHSASADFTGPIPVRVVSLNEHDEVIADSAQAEAARAPLPEDAARVAVQASSDEAIRDGLSGWQLDSMLTRAGRYTFLGDGCTVRPQAPPIPGTGRWSHSRSSVVRGHVEAAAVVAANQVQVKDRLQAGWIETLFGPGVQSVAVLLSHAASLSAAASVKLCWTDDLWSPAYTSNAEPVDTLTADGGTILIFAVPPSAIAGLHLAVLVQTHTAGGELAGVWASVQTASALAAGWGATQVTSPAVIAAPASAAPPAFTEMRLSVA